jgi:hypothetical protein
MLDCAVLGRWFLIECCGMKFHRAIASVDEVFISLCCSIPGGKRYDIK